MGASCGCCGPPEGSDEERTSLRNPLKNRGCTDIIPLTVFIVFWAGMFFIAGFSVLNGDALRLIYGYDSFGNTCGRKNEKISISNMSGMDMSDRKYVFFADIKQIGSSLELCVKSCPNKELETKAAVMKFSNESGSKLCSYDIRVDDYVSQTFRVSGPCPALPVYASTDILMRCIPSSFSKLGKKVVNNVAGFLNAGSLFEQVLADLMLSWKLMIVLCLIALGFSVLIVLLIRFIAAIVVWVIMIFVVLASIAGTAFLWWTYHDYKMDMDKQATIIPLLNIEIASEKSFLVYAIIATILTAILLLIIFIMRKRVALAVALFGEAGKCIIKMPFLLVQPVWTFLALIIFWVYWVAVFLYLSTGGDPVPDHKGDNETYKDWVKYEDKPKLRYMWWYHVIGLIWTSEFMLACQQMVISGAVATWYFTRDKNEVSCAVGGSICRLIMHHMGSVIFGSFIITLVKLPRWILMYTQKKLKGSGNECAQFVAKCCICCLWCLERCLKFLNQNAYTVVAIEGNNFCTSARKAFMTLVNNALRVVAINSIGSFVLFLGKISVMAATAAVGVLLFRGNKDLHYFFIPVLIVCIFAYFIAHCFLSVYEMVIDALLLCFCEDVNINDGTPGKEYYMDKSLMEFVKNSSQALDNLEASKQAEKSRDKTDGDESAPIAAAPENKY